MAADDIADARHMTTTELERHAALLFGRGPDGRPRHGWQARMIEKIPGKSGRPLSRESLRGWMRDDHVPAWAAEIIRAMAAIAPPPGSGSEDDRDDACAEAIEPELTRLRDLAMAAGWHPAEVAAAILSLTVGEIRTHAGDLAARAMLDQARKF